MKICPVCKEEVKDDAARCKWCQSDLGGPEIGSYSGKVVYVVDKGIVYFAKFLAGGIAVLLILGLYGFGFKLEDMLHRIDESRDKISASAERAQQTDLRAQQALIELQKAQSDMQKVQGDLDQKKKDIATTQAALAEANERARSLMTEIQQQKTLIAKRSSEVDSILVAFRVRLSPEQLNHLADAKAEQSGIVATTASDPRDVRARLWKNGTTIQVAFLGGWPTDLKARVVEISKEWLLDAGLKFDFTNNVDAAQIRISFQCEGNWSYLGTDALGIRSPDPTMCLNSIVGLKSDDPMVKRTILLEFGHSLGLVSEILNPNATIEWNKDEVYREMAVQGFNRESVDANFFRKPALKDYRPFDPQSVMMFSIPTKWLINGGRAYEGGSDLSVGDREFIRKLYPPT